MDTKLATKTDGPPSPPRATTADSAPVAIPAPAKEAADIGKSNAAKIASLRLVGRKAAEEAAEHAAKAKKKERLSRLIKYAVLCASRETDPVRSAEILKQAEASLK